MPSDIKERFGRYYILDHLVNGGMAKICRARFLGEQADRIVAIKMVQPQFSSDESFKQMFMDEIKVTFGLLHPNIVQTYDYGIHNDQLYVAMEYCDGRNLKEYLMRLKDKKFVFPVEISVYIISQVCQGLHYAHKFTDKLTGKAAHIIHRDISPHNIMLTYDGAVKVIDFGIAKAETNSESTQAGTIKGKLSYLAPEYLEGHELDPRYDIFSVGITLWEMLCSRKLFKAKNDLAVLKKIQECKIPAPSSINPNVPKELDEIVLKALAKDRTKRYEDIDQLNRALIKFLYANYPDFNSSDLGYFAKELFKEEIQKDREKLFEYGKIDLAPFIEEWKNERKGSSSGSDEHMNSEPGRKENVLDFGFDDTKSRKIKDDKNNAGRLRIDRTTMMKKKSRANAYGAKETQAAEGESESKTYLTVDEYEKEQSSNLKKKIASYAVGIALIAGGAQFYRNDVMKWLDVPSVESIQSSAMMEEEEEEFEEISKKLRIVNYNSLSHKVFLNGKRVELDVLKEVALPEGSEFVLRVEQEGYKHYIKEIDVSELDYVKLEIPEMEETTFGQLYASQGCNIQGHLYFDLWGESRKEKFPTTSGYGISFPVKGDGRFPASEEGYAEYTIYFQKSGESIQRKIDFSFSPDKARIDFCDLNI